MTPKASINPPFERIHISVQYNLRTSPKTRKSEKNKDVLAFFSVNGF